MIKNIESRLNGLDLRFGSRSKFKKKKKQTDTFSRINGFSKMGIL